MKMRKDYLRWVKIKNLFLKWAIQRDRFRHVKNIKSLKLQKYLKLKFINRPNSFHQHPVSNFLKETKKHIRESFKA